MHPSRRPLTARTRDRRKRLNPVGPFEILLIDPPWPYTARSQKGMGRSAESHYPTMTLADLIALPVERLMAANSVMVLWVTPPTLKTHAIPLTDAWEARFGLRYATRAWTWIKQNGDGSDFVGMGYYTRSNAEDAWILVRGKGLPRVEKGLRSVLRAAEPVYEPYDQVLETRVDAHSRKPDEQYSIIGRLWGDRPRAELFARRTWPGYFAWGHEVTGDLSLDGWADQLATATGAESLAGLTLPPPMQAPARNQQLLLFNPFDALAV